MKLIPNSGYDPQWFQHSPLAPSAEMDFEVLSQRVRRFDRNSVVLTASLLHWYSWNNDPPKTDLNYILIRHATLLANLAMIKCAPQGRPPIDEVSFRILCGDMFNIWPVADNPSTDKKTKAIFQAALAKHQQDYDLFQNIDGEEDVYFLNTCLTLGRTALLQWVGYSYYMSDHIRPMLIYRIFKELAVEENACSETEIKRAEEVFLGTTVERFITSVWIIFVLALDSSKKTGSNPGPIPMRKLSFQDDVLAVLDLTNDDISLVGTRLSVPASKFRGLREDLEKHPSDRWSYSKELWVLHDFPIVEFDDDEEGDGEGCFLVTSPWKLLRKMTELVLYNLIDSFEESKVLNGEKRAYSVRGLAYETYLFRTMDDLGLKKVDSLLPDGYRGPKCDFLWEDNSHAIFVEAKVRVRPNSDPTFFDPETLLTGWKSGVEAIGQAKATKSILDNEKKAVLLIVTEESLPDLVTQFSRAAKKWGFLEGSDLDAVLYLHTRQLEHLIRNESPTTVYEHLLNEWDKLDPHDPTSTIRDYDFFEPDRAKDADMPHIKAEVDELVLHRSRAAELGLEVASSYSEKLRSEL